MYRNSDEILTALKEGNTTLKSCQNSVSRYRKLKQIANVMMFTEAIEYYKMFYREQFWIRKFGLVFGGDPRRWLR